MEARQGDLFTLDQVVRAYADADALGNAELYQRMSEAAGIPHEAMEARAPVGTSGQRHSLAKRKLRWYQQTAKHMGLLERVQGERGKWRLTPTARATLTKAPPRHAIVAFSTRLGVALWARWESVFPQLDEPIHLCLTSPPFALAKPRAYGNPPESEYVDFLLRAMEPIVANLAHGGSICLNLSNDLFERGKPSRSLYLERLVLALNDRLGLSLMDRMIWSNRSKPPGPMQYASKTRQQLNVAFEFCLWLTNDPARCFSDNRRVLQPHTERHARLIAAGGEQRERIHSDGAYRIHRGSYANPTPGRIPRNVLEFGHRCADGERCNRYAREHGLPKHGAPMPLALADMLVRFLSRPGDLVVDPFGGRLTTGKAAEQNDRRWLCTEQMLEYLASGQVRFA